MDSIIQVKNLTKTFKDIIAVNDLSFSINEGDVYGFLGQNGAGKSTTIRMLLIIILRPMKMLPFLQSFQAKQLHGVL